MTEGSRDAEETQAFNLCDRPDRLRMRGQCMR